MVTDRTGQVILILAGCALLVIAIMIFEDTGLTDAEDIAEADPYAQDIADFRRLISEWEHGQ